MEKAYENVYDAIFTETELAALVSEKSFALEKTEKALRHVISIYMILDDYMETEEEVSEAVDKVYNRLMKRFD